MKGSDTYDIKAVVAITNKNMGVEDTYTASGIDRTEYESAMLIVNVGAASPAPSSFTVDVKIQHGATSTPATDAYEADGTTQMKITQMVAAGIGVYRFNIRHLHQYIRAYCAVTLTGGSSPKLPVSAILILYGGHKNPQS